MKVHFPVKNPDLNRFKSVIFTCKKEDLTYRYVKG